MEPSLSRRAATPVSSGMVAQQRGYHCTRLPGQSKRGQEVLRAYGADVVVCPTAVDPEDPRSYYSVSDRLARETPGGWKPDQYSNPHNPRSHYEVTGPEVWDQTQGRMTHFVAGVGTGGTLPGPGRYLKEVSDGAVKTSVTRRDRSTPVEPAPLPGGRCRRDFGQPPTTRRSRRDHRRVRRRVVRRRLAREEGPWWWLRGMAAAAFMSPVCWSR